MRTVRTACGDRRVPGCAPSGTRRNPNTPNLEVGPACGSGDWRTPSRSFARELVGGLYGLSLGSAFFGESMFHRERDASKVALVPCRLAQEDGLALLTARQ